MEPLNPTTVRGHCKQYLETQIRESLSLWDISPAVDRSLGYIDACARLLGLSDEDQAYLRREIQHNAVSRREHMIGVFFPPGTYTNQEIPEAGVNWWFKMNPDTRQLWLQFVNSHEPIAAWSRKQQVSAEYDRLCHTSLTVANDYLFATLPHAIRYA